MLHDGEGTTPLLWRGWGRLYDQLNRLTEMRQHTVTGAWSNSNIITAYRESISYDANGNILTYLRNGNATTTNMDNLTYHYHRDVNNHIINNRLNHVKDAVSSGNYSVDIDDQSANNYTYDKIGNLISDVAENITAIKWNVYGKIKQVEKSAETITYGYDAMGNRITKKTGVNAEDYYIRDAQGNVLALYSYNGSSATWKEQHLYGSSRLGIWHWDTVVPATPPVVSGWWGNLEDSLLIGSRTYELTNHLGNVLATISDKKIGNDSSGVVNYYFAEVLSQSDYYPFGMGMPGREYVIGDNYRYGFNNYEKLNEIAGIGNTIDFGERIYNSRLGRFNTTDTYEKKYPSLSPYSFSFNSPISFNDNNGDSVKIHHTNRMVGYTQINLYSKGEIAKKASRANSKVWVPVYEVTVSNESGSSATFYFTRYNERARIANGDKIEDVTFDVRESGNSFEGIKKKRWSKTKYDVLELRTIGRENQNDQWISGMKSYKWADRQAIQYHAKGASDGCLLCASEKQIVPLEGVEIDAEGTGTQSEFMSTIEKFQKEDKKNGKSDFIEVKFDRANYYMPGSSGSQDLQRTREYRDSQKKESKQ